MKNSEVSPTLDRIRAAGVLRVGTTGDYTPFSLKQPDGSYQGADIEMAHDLGETLGVKVVFVPSVWIARDPAMKRVIDDWLAERFASGAWQRPLDRAMRAHLEPPA